MKLIALFSLVLSVCASAHAGVIASSLHRPPPRFVLPFAHGTDYLISEGWDYSDYERRVHGFLHHRAVDFATERGTPVYAPIKGYALASFHLAFAKGEGEVAWTSAEARAYEGKFVGFGLGNFVQIYNPRSNIYVSLAHLEAASDSIPFFEPEPLEDGWNPTVLYQPAEEIVKIARYVQQGELVGYVGDSGCSWGYIEKPGQPRPNPAAHPSWDETHLHIEVYFRDDQGRKTTRLDPFGHYEGTAERYRIGIKEGRTSLWERDASGNIVFAR